ncbi:hypothetical protein V2G26_002708 [Clonostachys chloroleuca]
MKAFAAILSSLALVHAHYSFQYTIYDGKESERFEYIREIEFPWDFPDMDVTGPNMTCNRMSEIPFTKQDTKTLDVVAGSAIELRTPSSIIHQGPLLFYMAKVPDGGKVEEFDGKGNVWFKIFQDEPSIVDERIRWPNFEQKQVSVKIPECIPDGEYLLRLEHIGLHDAFHELGAQFFISCVHLNVTGGSGSFEPASLLSFPGSYDPTDPGLLIHIFYPVPTNYTAPGGPVLQCH